MPSHKTNYHSMELFKDPQKYYTGFARAIVQSAENNNFSDIDTKLLYLNEKMCDNSTDDANVTKIIENIVDQGMVETMWQVFVKMINQPISLSSSLMILLETLCNMINVSTAAKSKSSIFLPYLLRDIIGKAEHECSLRIEAAKLINTLIENVDSSNSDQINNLKTQKTFRDDVGNLLSNADDFELQALILEIGFRLLPPSERTSYISKWFESEDLQQLFSSIQDTSFEPGCRKFLNKLNNSNPEKRVYSIPCRTVFFGNEKVSIAKDTDSNNYWIDLNLGSGTLKFFVEEKDSKDEEAWWHTVVINADNVTSCVLLERRPYCLDIKISLKDDAAKLIPSLRERGDHGVFIRLGPDSKCDEQMLNELFHQMNWMKTEFLSPSKSSVAINVVHVGSRQRGSLKIIPSINSKPPETLMEGDEHDSDYPSSLTGQSQESASQPTSISSSKQDQERTQAKEIKSKEQGQIEIEKNIIIDDDEENEELPKDKNRETALRSKIEDPIPSKLQNIKDKEKSGGYSSDDKNKTKNDTSRRRRRGEKNSDMDSGAESSSSRQRSGRYSRSKRTKSPQPKKTKSPLPVEIHKSTRHSKYSSSTTTDDDKESLNKSHGGAKMKSAFDIAKEISKDTAKTYPKAFNVAKRMEAKKNSMGLSHSQELTKKVFGQKGRPFSKKTGNGKPTTKLPLKGSPSKEESSDKPNDEFAKDYDEVEVIQDSLPLDDSPEKISRRRSDIPKAPDRSVLEERLIKTAPPTKRTKKHTPSFEHVSPRLGTMLCKGGPSTRGSLLIKKNTGWGSPTSTSTTSTSESDWPAPNAEPGPKPRHSLVPRVSVREKRGARSRAAQQARSAKKKRASISPGLSAITEEQTTSSSNHDAKELSMENEHSPYQPDVTASVQNNKEPKKKEDDDEEQHYIEEDPPNYSKTDGSKRQITNKENKETAKKRKNQTEIGTIEDFPLDFPDLVLEGSSKEKSVSHAKSVKNDNIGTIEFVDEESIIYGTSTKHSHKRKSEEDSDENEYEIAEQKQTRRRKSSDDEYEIPKETKKRAEVSKEYKTRKKNKNYQLLKREASDDEIDDLYEKYLPPKRTRTYTTNKAKSYEEDGKGKCKTSVKKDTAEKSVKGVGKHTSFQAEDEFDCLQDVQKHDKMSNTTKTMLAPTRAVHDKKERNKKASGKRDTSKACHQQAKTPVLGEKRTKGKPKTPQTPKRMQNNQENDDDSEDNEAIKLRQFCENISGGKTSTPATLRQPVEDHDIENCLDDDDSDNELSGYSEVDTEPTERNYSIERNKEISKRKGHGDKLSHASQRLHPSVTQVSTNERFGKFQPSTSSKWKTPKQRRLDDSGIGVTPPSTGSHRSVSSIKLNKDNSLKGRRKGELLVTTSISKTPITPRTSAVIKRIDEKQTCEQNINKSRRKSHRFVDWTSSGPSKETQYVLEDDDEEEEVEEADKYIHVERHKAKSKSAHNPHIRPRQLFEDQHVSLRGYDVETEEQNYKSSDDSAIGDITNIMSELEGTLNERLRRKRNHLQRFCKKTFDVTLQTVSKHLEQSFASRDQLVDSFNDQFLDEMNTLKEEMEKTKKNEEQIMSRIQDDIKVLKTARVIQEKKVKSLRNICAEFQSELINDNSCHPQNQGALQDDIRQELIAIKQDFMREAQSHDRENLRRSLRSVLDVTMM